MKSYFISYMFITKDGGVRFGSSECESVTIDSMQTIREIESLLRTEFNAELVCILSWKLF